MQDRKPISTSLLVNYKLSSSKSSSNEAKKMEVSRVVYVSVMGKPYVCLDMHKTRHCISQSIVTCKILLYIVYKQLFGFKGYWKNLGISSRRLLCIVIARVPCILQEIQTFILGQNTQVFNITLFKKQQRKEVQTCRRFTPKTTQQMLCQSRSILKNLHGVYPLMANWKRKQHGITKKKKWCKDMIGSIKIFKWENCWKVSLTSAGLLCCFALLCYKSKSCGPISNIPKSYLLFFLFAELMGDKLREKKLSFHYSCCNFFDYQKKCF